MYKCENCLGGHLGTYGSGRFCGPKCSRGFSTKYKRLDINTKVSLALSGRSSPNSRFSKPHKFTAEDRKLGNLNSTKNKQNKILALPFNERSKFYKKKAIIEEQLGKCARCHLDTWLGFPMKFELEHKDGNTLNNSRENLEVLCPNCHSFTSTWRKKKSSRTV